jgi:hypothetical protein
LLRDLLGRTGRIINRAADDRRQSDHQNVDGETRDNLIGFGVLAGSIDSTFVVTPSHTPNATSSLFLRALAATAAGHVVATDLAEPERGRRHLLDRVEADERGEAAIRAQLVRVFERL